MNGRVDGSWVEKCFEDVNYVPGFCFGEGIICFAVADAVVIDVAAVGNVDDVGVVVFNFHLN